MKMYKYLHIQVGRRLSKDRSVGRYVIKPNWPNFSMPNRNRTTMKPEEWRDIPSTSETENTVGTKQTGEKLVKNISRKVFAIRNKPGFSARWNFVITMTTAEQVEQRWVNKKKLSGATSTIQRYQFHRENKFCFQDSGISLLVPVSVAASLLSNSCYFYHNKLTKYYYEQWIHNNIM